MDKIRTEISWTYLYILQDQINHMDNLCYCYVTALLYCIFFEHPFSIVFIMSVF